MYRFSRRIHYDRYLRLLAKRLGIHQYARRPVDLVLIIVYETALFPAPLENDDLFRDTKVDIDCTTSANTEFLQSNISPYLNPLTDHLDKFVSTNECCERT